MATFAVYEGAPGQGKSLLMCKLTKQLVKRNLALKEKYPELPIRRVYSNIKFSKEFEEYAGEHLEYWINTSDIVKLRDVDIIWDEIATELDSRNYLNLSDELKRFLSQYRKRGVDIYANTQDFSMIDLRARLMVTRVATLTKVIGSRDPSPTKPPVKRIWGFILIRDVVNYKETDWTKKKYFFIPGFFFIDAEDIKIYDTRQDIEAGRLPIRYLRKEVQQYVENGKVEFQKTIYR